MREHGEAAGAVNERRRLGNGEAILADIRRTTVAEIAIECIAEIDRPSLGEHRSRDVRASDGAARGLLEHRGEVDPHAELVQALDHALGTRPPHLSEGDELCLELPRVGQMEPENMSLHITFDGAELDTGHDAHPKL